MMMVIHAQCKNFTKIFCTQVQLKGNLIFCYTFSIFFFQDPELQYQSKGAL